jgi:phosphate-selective porin
MKLFFTLSVFLISCYVVGQQEVLTVDKRVSQLEKVVDEFKNIKINGLIQADYQYGEKDALLKVGGVNSDTSKGFNRIGIRRGRIKFTYEKSIVTAVIHIDMTERGVSLKDAFINVKDPWLKSFSIQAGVFNRPFGYEVGYLSSLRESPERSRLFQTLFPEERDLGAMLTLQAPSSSKWNVLKLEAGFFAGNGIKLETDNRKDFIGHLSYNQLFKESIKVGAGVSYYNGSVYQGTNKVYRMSGSQFYLDSTSLNKGKFGKREYFGVDFQIAISSKIGSTKLTSEFITGTQTGSVNSNKSPNSSSLPTTDSYIRPFMGAYAMLVQDLGKLPLSVVVKYDWFNPNTKMKYGNKTTVGDISYSTLGLGMLWKITSHLKLIAYFDWIKNETSSTILGYQADRKDNVFTLRFQYRF